MPCACRALAAFPRPRPPCHFSPPAATASSRLQPVPHRRAPAPRPCAYRGGGGGAPRPPRLQQGRGRLSGGGCFGRGAVEPEDAVPASAPSLNTPKCAQASSQNTSENDCMELSLLITITSQITIIIVVLHSLLRGITFGIGSRASSCVKAGSCARKLGHRHLHNGSRTEILEGAGKTVCHF